MTAGRLTLVGVVLVFLVAILGAVFLLPGHEAASAIQHGTAFEEKWLAAKGKKDGEIAHYELVSVLGWLDKVPDADPRKAEARAIATRLRNDEPLIKKMYDAGVERWAAGDQERRKAAAVKAEKESLPLRLVYGGVAEKRFLDQGMDVYVTVEGPEAKTLKLKYILMSRPLVHKISNETKTLEAWRELGFQKVILTDGYNQTWNLDLR